ncbi:hypothetical protein MANES_17G015855v8 [Manihot esculenta]|uniref:Uncharacterized protein n=1 Tax=Manihot esculenta TaxID=3983 RepID=A0ACB7G5V4_MANES|nr:hypothetical protein MANES_17G015855v8 [Manihot esculenta]
MCFLKCFHNNFMVLNGKDLSFEKNRPRRRLPGSAAESEVRPPNMERLRECFWPPKVLFERAKVRPPNMHEFRGHVRLPKVSDQATYKGPSDRKWASFLPFSRAQVSFCPPLAVFMFFFISFMFS